MTSPITLHIVSDLDLKISFDVKEYENHPMKGIEYVLKNDVRQGFPLKSIGRKAATRRDWTGLMSPISEVNLPPKMKERAGIPLEATGFAYIHPPRGLARRQDWDQIMYEMANETNFLPVDPSFHDDSTHGRRCSRLFPCCPADDTVKEPDAYKIPREWSLASFTLIGAFVYFDEHYTVKSVNGISFFKIGNMNKIRMAGPYNTPIEKVKQFIQWERFEINVLEQFHELGFVGMAWMTPKEDGKMGTFLVLKEDGTAISYEVRTRIDIDPSGKVSPLADLFESGDDGAKLLFGQHFVDTGLTQGDRISNLSDYIKNHLARKPLLESTFNNGRNIFHEMCYSRDENELFQELVDDATAVDLNAQDELYWTPLHYACRFRPTDLKLIEALLKICPAAFHKCDRFGRYPLHIACDSCVSFEVLKLLLKEDSKEKRIILTTTLKLKRLPLHIACQADASKEVIQALIEADDTEQTICMKTFEGRQALHIAIENRAHEDVIEVLLKADTTKFSVFEHFGGMLPLHIACWNGHYSAAKLLVAEDGDGDTIKEMIVKIHYNPIHIDPTGMSIHGDDAVVITRSKRRGKILSHRNVKSQPGMRALHIALLNKSEKIAQLLLHEEDRIFINGQATVTLADTSGMIPLHIACMNNADERIIKSLLNLDRHKKTVTIVDNAENTPLHYLCEHENVKESVVKMLLDAEEHYLGRNRTKTRTASMLNKQGMTPLQIAIKTGVSTSILEIFLDPKIIDLKGFEEQTILDLSQRVKTSASLQTLVNNILSERHPCALLMYSLILKTGAFVCMIVSVNCYIHAEFDRLKPWMITFFIIYVSNALFSEIIEIRAYGAGYISRSLKLFHWVSALFMILSIDVLLRDFEKKDKIHRLKLICAGTLLGIDIVLALRATFLPFAKFAGGLFSITYTLIPFFIVSAIILFTFAYIYTLLDVSKPDKMDDWADGIVCHEKKFYGCFLTVLSSFFDGGAEINRFPDIVFGTIVVVMLLTIVIAIVGNTWDAAGAKASQLYWESRVSFLANIRTTSFIFDKIPLRLKKKLKELANKIDEVDNVALSSQQKISWTKDTPYNQVTIKDEYDYPELYFTPDIAEVIERTQCLESELYWISRSIQGVQANYMIFLAIARWVAFILIYFSLIVLGSVTGGFFWPKNFRRYVLSYGYMSDEEDESTQEMVDKIFIHVMKSNKEAASRLDSQSKLEMIERETALRNCSHKH